jgi:hypothetical protein
MRLEEVEAAAVRLADETQADGIDRAYDELSAQLKAVSSQIDIATYMPGGATSRLGMAAKRPDGRGFFEVFRLNLRDRLCQEGGDFAELIKGGANYGMGAIVISVSRVLNLPPEGVVVVAPIAVLISNLGLQSFCEATRKPDELG